MNTFAKLSFVGGIAAALGAAPGVAAAQTMGRAAPDDPKPSGGDPNEPKPVALPTPERGALEIIQEIESKMLEAEKLLASASAAEDGSASMQEVLTKLDELLKNAGSKQQEILDALKKLEEQAVPVPSGSGGGDEPDPKNQQKPKPQNRPPDKEDKSLQKLDPGNSKDQGGKDGEKSQPEKGRQKPPDSKTDKNDLPKKFEQWGNLPPKLKEQITQGNFEMFPPQYRALLERFFKRLSDTESSEKK
jgi:hypothetical protein